MLVGTKAVGKRRAVWIAMGGIALYTVLVGADAAVVRAAIMGSLYDLALYFGRQAEVRTSLIFSALLMTAANPHTLWDVGFQLSFAATAGLIWLAPPLERAAERWLAVLVGAQRVRRAMGLISEALLVTLAWTVWVVQGTAALPFASVSAWGVSAPGCWPRFTPGWRASCGWQPVPLPALKHWN